MLFWKILILFKVLVISYNLIHILLITNLLYIILIYLYVSYLNMLNLNGNKLIIFAKNVSISKVIKVKANYLNKIWLITIWIFLYYIKSIPHAIISKSSDISGPRLIGGVQYHIINTIANVMNFTIKVVDCNINLYYKLNYTCTSGFVELWNKVFFK